MSTIEHGATTGTDDAAIEELHEIVERQREAFLADPFPSLEERQALLGALAGMLMSHRTQIQEAMSADFGVHPTLATDLIEVLGVAGRAAYAAEQLETLDGARAPLLGPRALRQRARVRAAPAQGRGGQHRPVELPVRPLRRPAGRDAGGGQPRGAQALGAHAGVLGAAARHDPRDVRPRPRGRGRRRPRAGQAFTRVRWDHLLYTGSPEIGREIAKAAAEQLVPVTLELGGKCPAILTDDSIDAESVKQVLGTKALKNGQMCISVDYCLVPRERMEDFARLAAEHVRENMPGFYASESNTGIITTRHLERIQSLIDDARTRGCDVRPLEEGGDVDPDTRQLPMSLVLDPPDDLALMQEEIFGPILPVKAYDGSTRPSGTSTRASARSRCTCSRRTSRWPTTCCGAPRPAARA